MSISKQISKHFRGVFFGGNWTASNLKDQLTDVTWRQATTKVKGLNTILTLVYHISYYVTSVTQVLKGGPLTGKDKFSFDHPPIHSEKEWTDFVAKVLLEAEAFAALIEAFPEEKILEDFIEPKYGNYYRNLNGIIEHTHYHLGQISLIKKMLKTD
jgi:hypothetical protein